MSGAPAGMRTVMRGAGLIFILTVLARIAGFARYLVFGGTVGGGDVGTAYATVNLLPNVLFEITAGGALAAMVVPLVAGLFDRADGREEADRIISALLWWVLLITVPMAVLILLLAGPLASALLGASAGPEMVSVGRSLLAIFAPQIPLYGIAVVLGAALQAQSRFLWPALLPLLSSLVVMASYVGYSLVVPTGGTADALSGAGLWLLGGGTTAGVLAMALPVLLAALRAGWKPRLVLTMPPGVGAQARRLGLSGLGAVAGQQAVTALIMVLAMRAGGTGTLVLFQYAQAVYLLPYAVLAVPVMTAVFPRLSELRLTGDTIGFARTASASLRIVIALSLIGSSALIAAAPAVDQFFALLDRASVQGVGPALAALSLGLGGYCISMLTTRVLAAALHARDALIVGSVGWGVAGLLIALFTVVSQDRRPAEAATVFALSIAMGMGVAAFTGLLRVDPLLSAGDDQQTIRRLAWAGPVVLAVGALPGYLVVRVVNDPDSAMVGVILAGMIAGIVAAVLSAAILLLLDRELFSLLRGGLHRKEQRSATTAASSSRADVPRADPVRGTGPGEETS